jgi:hypothetical protein
MHWTLTKKRDRPHKRCSFSCLVERSREGISGGLSVIVQSPEAAAEQFSRHFDKVSWNSIVRFKK